MAGFLSWVEQTTGLNVSNYDFDSSGTAVSYTNPETGVSTSVSDDDGKSSMDYAAEVGAYGFSTDADGNISYFDLGGEEASIPASQTTDYSVKAGDTLGEIAGRNNTTVAEIAALNGIPLEDVNTVYVGQDLIVPQNTIDRSTTSVFAGLPSSVFDSAFEEATTLTEYQQKLLAAGEELSTLDMVAEASAPQTYSTTREGALNSEIGDTFIVDGKMYIKAAGEPGSGVVSRVVEVEDTSLPSGDVSQVLNPRSESLVNYDVTGSGKSFVDAATDDTSDIVGGVDTTTDAGSLAESIMSASVGKTEGDLATMDLDGNGVIT